MMQPQMLQSPARLGLPNPNSPSLSNPTTPKLHYNPSQSQQQSPLQSTLPTTTTTTSSTLLSLLPPLSRAQSLLLQMASLATKLFEVSPNRSVWLSAFRGSLPTFLGSQTQGLGLTPPMVDPVPNTVKDIMIVFTALQTQLFEAVAELQEILDLQDAKQKIARDIRAKDSCLLAFANKIKEAENVLDVLVDDYSDYRKSKRLKLKSESGDSVSVSDFDVDMSTSDESVGTKLCLADILSYAHRISYTTFAPPEFGAGVGPLRGALPPAPQEEQMRASQLYAFADLDVGLPKIVKAEERTIDSLVEPSVKPSENADLGGMQGIIPSQITVPTGWQPGMPVELPPDLPLPPPGWKPGDPIPLPPMGGLAPNVEEKPRPVTNMQPKAPEPIQVRFVQLDINPEQDDDDSYSSSEASSEEDDED